MKSTNSFSIGNRTFVSRLLRVCLQAALLVLVFTPPRIAKAIWSSYPVVEQCYWSTTVRLISIGNSQHCTGVYLGSGVIVTAGHCAYGAAPIDASSDLPGVRVYFGEITSPASQAVANTKADCTIRPDFEVFECGLFGDQKCGSGPDLAYCVMREVPEELDAAFGAKPLESGALVFPMAPTGCERDWLYDRLYVLGEEVLGDAIGMGSCDKTPTTLEMGAKRHVVGQLVRQVALGSEPALDDLGMAALEMYQPSPYDLTKSLGNGEYGEGPIRHGDSGGPLMMEMPDGSHRLIGIAAAIKGRNNYDVLGFWSHFVYYTPVPPYLRWIESDSGIDVTPCHEWEDGGGWKFLHTCMASYGDATPEGRTWSSGCYEPDGKIKPQACGGAAPSGTAPTSVALPPGFGASAGSDLDWQILNVTRTQQGLPGVEVLFGHAGVEETLGTRESDDLPGTPHDDLIRAAAGNDEIHGAAGADVIVAGPGDDQVFGGEGNDRIHPGAGEDFVDAGAGDDHVVVYDPCELAAGEALVGGPGNDMLITPLTSEKLATLGVHVDEFESIVVTPSLGRGASCSNPRDAAPWTSMAPTLLERLIGPIPR
jgi:hypothetical protein